MATLSEHAARTLSGARPPGPDRYERILSIGALFLFGCVAVALVRGRSHWAIVPAAVWLHLGTILIALVLTPVLLLRPRGTPGHRLLGRIWAGAMLLTAAISFAVRTSPDGRLGPIHLLSAATLLLVPLLVIRARRHQVAQHRRIVRGIITGALLIAGAFTFPFGRMLGSWLFG